MLPHVFISYAHADDAFVSRLVADLERFGVPIWIDRSSLSPQDATWDEGIRRAIEGACALLLIATPTSRRSAVVQGEISIARARNRRVICLWASGDRWEDAAHVSLVHTQYLDCRGKQYAAALPRIIREIMLAQADMRAAATGITGQEETADDLQLGLDDALSLGKPDATRTTLPPLNVLMIWDSGADAETPSDGPTLIAACQQALKGGHAASGLRLTVAHAQTPPEIVLAVQASDYDIIVFVGHYFCTREQTAAYQTLNRSLVKSWQFASILRSAIPKSVRAILLASSCCMLAAEDMVSCASYLITIESVPGQPAIPQFLNGFFKTYEHTRSIEQGYQAARLRLEAYELLENVSCQLANRERRMASAGDELMVRVPGLSDPFVLNLSDVVSSLEALGVSADTMIDLLRRKVKAHAALFRTARDNALLPIDGLLHGEFSWNASDGYIRCSRLVRFADTKNPVQWREWCRLLLTYNDLCGSEYRATTQPGAPTSRTLIAQGLHRFQRAFATLEPGVRALTNIGITNAQYAYEMGATYLEQAQAQYDDEDLPRVVASLEGALTCLHSIVDSTMPPIGAASTGRSAGG